MNIGCFHITVILYFRYTHTFVELVVINHLCLIFIVLMTCIDWCSGRCVGDGDRGEVGHFRYARKDSL